jgi:hypothetical protein
MVKPPSIDSLLVESPVSADFEAPDAAAAQQPVDLGRMDSQVMS